MKQLAFLVALFLGVNSLFSQEPETVVRGHIYGAFEVGDTSFTLVSDANIRDKAATTSAVVAKLAIGTPLKIEKVTTDSLTIKGVRAPWYQVSFSAENRKKTGYIWGGFIASVFYADTDYAKNEVYLYLGGIAAFDEKNYKLTTQLRVAKNGQQVAALEFPTCGDLSYHGTLEMHTNNNFENVRQTLTYGSIYEACDYPNGHYLIFLMKNGQMQKVTETVSASSAGMGYMTESYLLPTQRGGIGNHILVTEDTAEMEEKGNDFRIKNQKYKISLWKWNGAKLVKVQ